MASSLPSLDAAGSPLNPVNSVIHLCMSVNRTVSGSVSGYLSASAIAMSSKLSQPNVGGISCSLHGCVNLVVCFLRVILIPVGNLHNNIRRTIRHGLATETRLRRYPRRFIQLIEFRISGFVAGFKTLLNDHVARRAGTHAA